MYVYVHNILQGDLPTRASGRERSGQSSVHFGEIGSIAGLRKLTTVFSDTSSEPPVGFYAMPPHLTCSLGWSLGPVWGGGVVLGC